MMHHALFQAPVVCYDLTLRNCGGKPERAEKYLRRFCENEIYQAAAQALQDENREQLRLHLHTLRGMALNLGFIQLAEATESLDTKIRFQLTTDNAFQEALPEVQLAFFRIEQAYDAVIQVVTKALEASNV